ncbi:MAG: NAD(P)-dependent alcohol dehydrogenase [Anaerolineaceae bacterium]|jgi:NADPH:quinone reductase-like Zn-dependent oxidoreductase
MKAIVCTSYGSPDVLKLQEVEKPLPGDKQLLIKVHAASVNSMDWHLITGSPVLVRLMGMGFFKPKDPRVGADLAGRVEAVGSSVTQFKPGDEVFGRGDGTFAEYALAGEKNLVLKPASLSFEAAAAVPVAAITALQALRDKGGIQPGQKVLINGAGGGVGTFAVQIAKAFGAEVTAVCGTRHVDKVRSLGADHVIDYTQEDVTKKDERYDLIVAINGYHSIFEYGRLLNPGGRFVIIGAANARLIWAMSQTTLFGSRLSKEGKKVAVLSATINHEDLVFLKDLIEAGKVTPVIDRTYSLSEVPEAIRYMDAGHVGGKIVIRVIPESKV